MPINRPNHLSLSVLGELNFEGFDAALKRLKTRIEQDDSARDQWIQTAYETEQQLRSKVERQHPPWKGACELSPPLTKKLLRRWIPVVYNLFAHADPLCYFKTGTAQAAYLAPKAEEFFNWLVKDYMLDVGAELALLGYGVGSRGQDYIAVDWDYRTELETRVAIVANIFPAGVPSDVQAIITRLAAEYEISAPTRVQLAQLQEAAQKILIGAQAVRVESRCVIADRPRMWYFPTESVIVPPDSGQSTEAEYVCLKFDMTPDQLRRMAFDGVLNPKAVEELISRVAQPPKKTEPEAPFPIRRFDDSIGDQMERDKMTLSGVQAEIGTNTIRIYKIYCWMDRNGDGIEERIILWVSPLEDFLVLAAYDFPFSFKMWPVVRFDYERVSRRPYQAQGIGQQIKAIQEQYTRQYRATADAIDIQLAPVFQARVTSGQMGRNIKWAPGKVIPVMQVGDIAPVEKSPFNLHEYLQDRGELKLFAEEMVGSIDAALAATGRSLERRTAFEVQAVSGQIEAMQGMDAALWQQSMAKVFQIIWGMWLDLGPEEVYFNVTGEQIPKLFQKSQYRHQFQLIPAGTPGNTNRAAELQRNVQAVQVIAPFAGDVLNRTFIASLIFRLIDPRMVGQAILPEAQQQAMAVLRSAATAIAQGDIPESMKAFGGTGSSGAAPGIPG
jgi:hypothetical protein